VSEELRFSLRLPAHPFSVSIARGVLKLLDPLVNGAHLEAAELVLSELVTNSVRHGSTSVDDVVDIELTVSAHRMSGVVRDGGPPFEPLGSARAPDQSGGFGLDIARKLADLTIDRTEGGNVVTFTVSAGASIAMEGL
jgi:anti-sigma regulatory factor (Ser/Thr protein kinase)